ncbi:Pilin (type 1 fimbria component protein) [Pseudomonas chlororaphis]|uniref:fimbrial protein n=1 Tax=Pseudomonas chlororaphis TaxID=587753 RepID=UPI00087D9AE4|nr:fimbrial protein [Pseudomonas chlororaphis]AZD69490.1 fimbrial subunit CupC1 [Pseudomonas chlororaphis subsp. aurantiaca]QIT25322.1 type 1 fimbrial protein [Pseudomonas chlororaphis subsp. aurantiaca]WDH03434.1 fimbrial protein [Pseudomonas chlororaphis]WDH07718.1 fimbrial protein [Pseudomonas chlororaphis]SDS21204.1 Pilin (type 1 fimbria component protein) [Pseudomonas chlororaphis]
MSKLLKNIVSMAIAGAVSTSALAADGTINFTGEIVAASCSITGGTGATAGGNKGAQTIDINLGKVSTDSIGGTSGGGVAGGKNINLNLDCGTTAKGLTSVKLQFDPANGSGIDLKNGSLLKTTGTAKGVAIGLYDSNNKLLNLAANETINGALTSSGEDPNTKYTAKLDLRAGYVANGEAVTAGTANGTLPFTLTYE